MEDKKPSLVVPDINAEEGYRQRVATVDQEGKRKWIFPKKPTGRYHRARVFVTIFQLAVLFGTPFIRVNGLPFFLLNVVERRFILFGITFWPQDFFILALVFVASIIFIVLFTVLFGRLFCGWVCPQTVFMEMVFRKVEYWIEGDYTKQKVLDKAPWTTSKIFKKTLKHGIFFGIAILISNTFLAYVIGTDELFKIITDPIDQHWIGFITLIGFSGVFYWIFAWFREQVCLIACPYGRLQGVMLDKNSMVVAYDYKRGEPRGKLRKNEPTRSEGDCIDCKLCYHVCPTGIDIRNGTQLECINCTACMDACDSIMDHIDKPKGLIRLDSENHIANGTKFKFDARMFAYTLVLLALIGIITGIMVTRTDVQATVLRSRGHLYQKEENGNLTNIYKASLVNKTTNDIHLDVRVLNKKATVNLLSSDWHLKPQSVLDKILVIELPKSELDGLSTMLELGVFDQNGKLITTTKTKFLGPMN